MDAPDIVYLFKQSFYHTKKTFIHLLCSKGYPGKRLLLPIISTTHRLYVDSEDFQESVEELSPEEGEMVKEQLRQLGYI